MFSGIFGKKTSSSNGDYGKKDESIFQRGIKFVADKAGSVADAADKVSDISGTIASGAATLAGGAAFIGLEPVAAGLGAVAAGAKGVQGISTLVGKGAKTAGAAARGTLAAERAIDRAQRGDIMGAIEAGKTAGTQFKAAGAGASVIRKDIQRKRK
jgi:uncharacterized phage infection (PIP) family protein YhgE